MCVSLQCVSLGSFGRCVCLFFPKLNGTLSFCFLKPTPHRCVCIWSLVWLQVTLILEPHVKYSISWWFQFMYLEKKKLCNFSIFIFCLLKLKPWYYSFSKIQQIFSLCLKIVAKTTILPDNNDMQAALTGAYNLSLMATATFFFCSWAVKSLCSTLSVLSLQCRVFTFLLIKLHTAYTSFSWICAKWKKYLFAETRYHNSSRCEKQYDVFSFLFFS